MVKIHPNLLYFKILLEIFFVVVENVKKKEELTDCKNNERRKKINKTHLSNNEQSFIYNFLKLQ